MIVHDLILHRIRLRSRRRVAWLRKIWSETGTDGNKETSFNLHTEIDGCLDITDKPADENDWYIREKSMHDLNNELQDLEETLNKNQQSRLSKLASTFGLSEPEKDIIQACLALHIDPNLGRVYAYLQDHNIRSYVSRQLVARLFQHGPFISIGSSSPLRVWRLVTETDMGRSEPARIDCDPFIVNWLLGSDDLDSNLVDFASLQTNQPSLKSWPVNQTADLVRSMLQENRSVRFFISGAAGTGKHSFATAVCEQLKLPLLSIQTKQIDKANWTTVFMLVQRQAWLDNCSLLWEGNISCETCWPFHIKLYPLQFVVGNQNESIPGIRLVTDIRFEMPDIPAEEAFTLWHTLVPNSDAWPKEELKQLIKRQPVGIGSLAAISRKKPNNVAEASEMLRSLTRSQLGKLAHLINSTFSRDDLIVPSSLGSELDALYFEATERAAVWEDASVRKHFPQGRGLIALFTGSPGTGKTMAAQVIANQLQLDIFRVDLSTVVSKYIGETSKNIERILSRAAGMNAILLCDEADSLFGKRTEIKDAHDRYANTDTNYLLQAIEEYPGIAILASNRKANIDSGFTRRLRYVLDFPKPDLQHRLLLWRKLITELTGQKNSKELDADIFRLSELLEVTGAQIKQAILSAIFMARREKTRVTTTHLLKGMERELRKENRGIGKQVQEMMK